MDDFDDDASTTALFDLSFEDNFGVIDYAGDQDWLRLELAGGTSYEIHVHGQDLGHELAEPRIRIFDSASNLIASAAATDGSALLEFTALSYGTHHVSIDSSDPEGIGTYSFHGFGDDNSGSQRLTLNSETLGALEYLGDEDSFEVRLVAGAAYTFDLSGQATAGGTLGDPLLELRDAGGTVVASDDDSGAGADARILFTPTASGSYTLAARESGGDGLGSYALLASVTTLGLAVAAVDADRLEGSSGNQPFTFSITRNDDLTAAINVAWAVTGNGASPTNAADFANGVLPSGNIAFAAGESSKTLTVNGRGDTQIEPDESFLVTVSSPANGAASAAGMLRNDDGVASIAIAATSSSSAAEGSGGETPFAFTVTRAGDLSAANAVTWAVAGSGANPANAADFTDGVLPSGTVTFAANETSKTITVGVRGDTQLEATEGFLVTLSSPTNGAVLGAATAGGSIQNDDSAASISIATTLSSSIPEGSSGETPFAFTVSRTGDLSAANAVAWAVTGSGANPANATDFTNGVLPAGTVTFAAGESSKTITVGVHGDTQLEQSEGFLVTLSGATNGALLGTATAAGSIQNDDSGLNAINGTSAGETLTGTTGPDQIQALGGNDVLLGRLGSDILDGGSGTDRADWLSDGGTTGVNADLTRGTAVRGAETDTLTGIEDLRGTQFADSLFGNGSANSLDGDAGADTLNGAAGNDVLTGGTGNNSLDGGSGTDRVSYSGTTAAVALDLATDTAARGTESDRILNIENATGSSAADTLRGDNAANLLQGLGGNDTLFGLGGVDQMVGGTGRDTMTGGTGNDVFVFAAGDGGVGANADVIKAFDGIGAAAGDIIDLRGVYSGTLSFRGTSQLTGLNQLHVVNDGTVSGVEINLSGSTAPDLAIRIEDGSTSAAAWRAADFML